MLGRASMRKTGLLVAIALAMAAAATATATAQTHNRLKIVNQCDDDAWAVFTPGGAPDQPSVQANSGAWFLPYATQLYFEDPGWLGTVARNSTMMTLSSPGKTAPGFVFVAGQIVKVKGAGAAGGDLTTLILKVMNENRVLVLKDPAKTAVIKATVLYDTLQGAVLVKRATTRIFAVPDRGAPNGNFRFFMGCPSLANNNNPFGGGGCVIGAITGDLANVNTLFEPTLGCMKGSKTCAFNPAANPATHPLCPSQPNAKNCGPLSATDFYDVSAVDGYTLPIEVAASGKGCSAPLIDASMLDLASCPSENKKTLYSTNAMQQAQIEKGFSLLTSAGPYRKACVAPYLWFEFDGSGFSEEPQSDRARLSKGRGLQLGQLLCRSRLRQLRPPQSEAGLPWQFRAAAARRPAAERSICDPQYQLGIATLRLGLLRVLLAIRGRGGRPDLSRGAAGGLSGDLVPGWRQTLCHDCEMGVFRGDRGLCGGRRRGSEI